MSDLFNRTKKGDKRKKKAFRAFEEKCGKEKSLNLNPLLSIIINLIPMFLIVLNMRAIVGFEQKNTLEANFLDDQKQESKVTFNVELKLYKNSTKVIIRDHKGLLIKAQAFSNILKSKDQIVEFLVANNKNLDHLNILTPGSQVTFDEIGQAIDLSKIKVDPSSDTLFANFSIGNIL